MPTTSERYLAQQPWLGATGQDALAKAQVAVLGLGGLGSAASYALAGLGVGRLLLFDDDVVSVSNLNRQFLYAESDLGKPKALCAAARLSAYNSEICIVPTVARVDDANAASLLDGCDVVLCCVDRISTRLSLCKALRTLPLPQVHGGVDGCDGTLMLVTQEGPCLGCALCGVERLARKAPAVSLPPVTTAVSALMAQMALLSLTGRAASVAGKLFCLDGRTLLLDAVPIVQLAACPICGRPAS